MFLGVVLGVVSFLVAFDRRMGRRFGRPSFKMSANERRESCALTRSCMLSGARLIKIAVEKGGPT